MWTAQDFRTKPLNHLTNDPSLFLGLFILNCLSTVRVSLDHTGSHQVLVQGLGSSSLLTSSALYLRDTPLPVQQSTGSASPSNPFSTHEHLLRLPYLLHLSERKTKYSLQSFLLPGRWAQCEGHDTKRTRGREEARASYMGLWSVNSPPWRTAIFIAPSWQWQHRLGGWLHFRETFSHLLNTITNYKFCE